MKGVVRTPCGRYSSGSLAPSKKVFVGRVSAAGFTMRAGKQCVLPGKGMVSCHIGMRGLGGYFAYRGKAPTGFCSKI